MKSIIAWTVFLAVATRWASASDEAAAAAAGGEDWQRTVVLIQKEVNFGQSVFLRGGIDASQCTDDTGPSACAIPIRHSQISGTANTQYNDWSAGDDYLDWYGAESDQGTTLINNETITASGTPLVWTTNDEGADASVAADGYGYTPLNTFDPHYWLLDVEMDCSETEEGWFELKGYVPGENPWEPNVAQDEACSGTADATKPYTSNNHFAKCGYLNKFVFNSGGCQIDSLESEAATDENVSPVSTSGDGLEVTAPELDTNDA